MNRRRVHCRTGVCTLALLATFLLCCARPVSATPPSKAAAHLTSKFWDLAFAPDNTALTSLRADPTGKGRFISTSFVRRLAPENWEGMPETHLATLANRAALGPFRVWRPAPIALAISGAGIHAERLMPGETLAQTFRVPARTFFTALSVRLPTWNTKDAAVTLQLFRGEALVVQRRIIHAEDNAWQELRPDKTQSEGIYRVEISEAEGQIGWWSKSEDKSFSNGQALRNGKAEPGTRALRVDTRRDDGEGSLSFALRNETLAVETNIATPPELVREARPVLPWRWQTTWTKNGYDVSAHANIVFSRYFSDNQRYMAASQLKRRTTGGVAFDNCRWIEMEGTGAADLRLDADRLHLHWEMSDTALSLRLDTPQTVANSAPNRLRSHFQITVLPRKDTVPESFPRFVFADASLTDDTNRFWWERNFSYPGPALPAAWFEWEAIARAWVGGPIREGEMKQLETYPMMPNGYVHTWYADPGWPLRPTPTTDTRHADTNARFILACWRYWLWTGDTAFLQRQADRLRRAMRYQLENLHGRDGLIVTESADVQGRHADQSDNYWDILPFGYLDAYANTVFYASLQAMDEMETALGSHTPDRPDYAALQKKAHARYDAVFWDDAKGRFIGCVDKNGTRHDFGFTFVNIEALYYGLGNSQKARRIYHWMETEPTATGKADTYSRFVFAPRATTIHNPMWGEKAHQEKSASNVAAWWVSWWKGTPYGKQCQDGGAILYVSYFDLMVRLRYFGIENAWKRWQAILGRWRFPDHLSGGAPLSTGDTPQQETAGQVGVDYPFPENGMVPCFLLYGVLGIEATPAGLRVTPRLPPNLPFAAIQSVAWQGATLNLRATGTHLEVRGTRRDGSKWTMNTRFSAGKSLLIPRSSLYQSQAVKK